ncbi:unnamed protein product [Coregonus sp. 'balchen']|nr:unnamed protein product [Coregonus sp. 'balchen']
MIEEPFSLSERRCSSDSNKATPPSDSLQQQPSDEERAEIGGYRPVITFPTTGPTGGLQLRGHCTKGRNGTACQSLPQRQAWLQGGRKASPFLPWSSQRNSLHTFPLPLQNPQRPPQRSSSPGPQTVAPTTPYSGPLEGKVSGSPEWQKERWQIGQLLSADNTDILPETLV